MASLAEPERFGVTLFSSLRATLAIAAVVGIAFQRRTPPGHAVISISDAVFSLSPNFPGFE
jgi:hypothetical protein